ncbi:multicopper oxidase domain-containing protein [Yimella sp. cx-573]|nr:multicopper oxidase domain-containing protein [Yimella sp. cx-573]
MTDAPTRPQTSEQASGRGRWALRDRPGVAWLALAVLVSLVHPFVPESRWLMVHLVLLGAMTHSVIVWSTYFTEALLKTPAELDPQRRQSTRIVMLIVGVTMVLVGVPTTLWPLTVAGAVIASAAVLWHGVALWIRLRHSLSARFRISVRYYLAAALCMPVGAGFGATLARGLDDELHGRMLLAHTMTMVLGWLGLTVMGTLVTLWPTMLRTRMDERGESLARQALPVVVIGLVVLDAGALIGVRPMAVAGLVGYALGVLWWGRALLRPARQAPPKHAATYFVSAAICWAAVLLVVVPIKVATAPSWSALADSYGVVTAIATVGFALQLLTGALSHLIPVVLGGGAAVVRAGQEKFDKFAVARVTTINLGMLLWLAPTPPVVRVMVSSLALLALVTFIPLMFAAIKAAVLTRIALVKDPSARGRDIGPQQTAWSSGQFIAAVSALALAVSVGVAADPVAAGLPTQAASSAGAAVTPTGKTTTVQVTAHGMRFSPSSITVPRGNRLVVVFTNHDTNDNHDIAFPNGKKTKRLKAGQSATLDVGVIGESLQAWCTLVGHRAMGMTLDVKVSGSAAPVAQAAGDHSSHVKSDATVPAGFRAVDPALPAAPTGTVHKVTLTVREVELEVAPGVRQKRWTFEGGVPGPTLHGKVGDTFEVTLVNRGSMGHSIDFHAGAVAPDEVMRTIQPGQSLLYRFVAQRAGIWMYHCSTMPMSAHISAGMFGAVVIEPPGLPTVDRNYLLIQSEAYVDGDGRSPVNPVNADAVMARRPSFVTFNGVAGQYDHRPLTAKPGERVRVWVLDAGPNVASSFHIVGLQFDTVYFEGGYLLKNGKDAFGSTSGGSQALALQPAQGGFVEFTPTEAGRYPFVSHIMSDAESGAHGFLDVK